MDLGPWIGFLILIQSPSIPSHPTYTYFNYYNHLPQLLTATITTTATTAAITTGITIAGTLRVVTCTSPLHFFLDSLSPPLLPKYNTRGEDLVNDSFVFVFFLIYVLRFIDCLFELSYLLFCPAIPSGSSYLPARLAVRPSGLVRLFGLIGLVV